jgi:hypothetical protein
MYYITYTFIGNMAKHQGVYLILERACMTARWTFGRAT